MYASEFPQFQNCHSTLNPLFKHFQQEQLYREVEGIYFTKDSRDQFCINKISRAENSRMVDMDRLMLKLLVLLNLRLF